MRILKKGILSLLLAAIILSFAACGQDKVDYEKLKTDIVGIWCDSEGPELLEDSSGNPYYQLYEFTSDGRLAYHIITRTAASYYDFEYTLRDNFLDIDNSMCKVSISDDDIMTMTNDNGDTKYRRMSMEEVCNFGVVYLDSDNYLAQIEYTNAFTQNWPGAAASEDTASAETPAESDVTDEASESLAS